MAFLDKLGQVANKVGEVAGDTLDYGKAKGKVVMEKGKIKDLKEEMGDYIYNTLKACEALDMDVLNATCAKIDEHLANIEQLEDEASVSGASISDAVSGAVNEVKNTVSSATTAEPVCEEEPVVVDVEEVSEVEGE